MKKVILLLSFCFFIGNLFAQSPLLQSVPLGEDRCGYTLIMNNMKAKGFDDLSYESLMENLIQARRNQMGRVMAPPTTIYNLPIVFHILYDGNTEATIGTGANILESKVLSQIKQLNLDFGNMSGSPYVDTSEDMGIRFIPARVDPNGNYMCEGGINRIDWRAKGWTDPSTMTSTSAVSSYFTGTVKPQSIWDPTKYINIWVANFRNSGLLGYATFPGLSTLAGLDNGETNSTAGVVILSGTVGSLDNPGSTASYDLGRTLTHELGHFFGLRHIWGDGNCATDYCDDTPPQSAATNGCPTWPATNNCTPPYNKMFQNYMDYSGDGCLNTFTLNQSERCQVVMLNSPRRKELINSTTGVSPNPNRIYIKSVSTAVNESSGSTSCPSYKDYDIVLGVESAATGAATVSLSKAGTSTDLVDYTLLNNSVTYTNGDGTDKKITLRVYDDLKAETAETIILDFVISGTGVKTISTCGTTNFTITINDNDYDLDVNNTSQEVVLMNENFDALTNETFPTNWTVTNAGASSTNTWRLNAVTGNGFTTGKTAHIARNTTTLSYSATAEADARLVTSPIDATGLQNLTLSFNYACNGEASGGTYYDLGLVYCSINNGPYAILKNSSGNNLLLQGVTTKTAITVNLPASAAGASSIKLMFRWINDNGTANNPALIIDDIVVKGYTSKIATTLAQTKSGMLQVTGNNLIHFYDKSNNDLIASLNNLSTPIGCATAAVAQSGTGQKPINTTMGSYLRTDKVITITPTTANSTASYNATMYLTTDEANIWGSAATTLKMVKIKDGVSLSTVLNNADVEIATPVVTDLRSTKGYIAYSANFTTGFSQYVLASADIALPVYGLDFSAKGMDKYITLQWSVVGELNNSGYQIERSIDGSRFNKIGWKEGAGTSNASINYNFDDYTALPNTDYYYRLAQTDHNGQIHYSEVRKARYTSMENWLVASPNPASEQIQLTAAGFNGKLIVRMFDAHSKHVRTWKVSDSKSPIFLSLHNVASGNYVLQVTDGKINKSIQIVVKK